MNLLILLTTLVSLATAIFIDDTLQDGIYTSYRDPDNPDSHILRRHLTLPPAPGDERATLLPRGRVWDNRTLRETVPLPKPNKVFCWDTHDFQRGDFRPSINDLFVDPLYWMPPESVRFSLHRSVVTFVCNLGFMNTASLLEFMDAMDMVDHKCGADRGGKVSIPGWDKMYGRESRGEPICEWETEKGGLKNELMDVQECKSYVNGVDRWFHRGEPCNMNNGWEVLETIKKKFPWWHNPVEDKKPPEPEKEKFFNLTGLYSGFPFKAWD